MSKLILSLDDWTCSLCSELHYEPLTTPCGHTFCRICLYNWFYSHQKECPLCRAPCSQLVPLIASTNVLVNNFIKVQFPDEYNKRKIECDLIKRTWIKPIAMYISTNELYILPFQSIIITISKLQIDEIKKHTTKMTEPMEFLLLPLATKFRHGDIGIIARIIFMNTFNINETQIVCHVQANRRCKLIDCWITDQVNDLYCAQIEPFEDSIPSGDEVKEQEQNIVQLKTLIQQANDMCLQQFTGRQHLAPVPPFSDVDQISWWVLQALSFNEENIQASIPSQLLPFIMKSQTNLQRLKIANHLLSQFIIKLATSS